MNIKSLTDKTLLESTDTLARKEQEILGAILRHLREIERRRLFSSLGYSSLFTYCVGRLGYSEDQAYHRISAMRILRELPEMERAQISLTNLSLAGSAFRRRLLAHKHPGRPPKRTARARKAESPAAPRVNAALQRRSCNQRAAIQTMGLKKNGKIP